MSYKHFDADKTRLASPAQPTDEATDEKPSLLKDVSITQILATSLAAVTAFVLSNQIGIAGSIIGVAVGAAASALASQIYQNVISAPRINSALTATMNITSRHIQTAAKQRLKAHNISSSTICTFPRLLSQR